MSDDARTRGVEFDSLLDDVAFPIERGDLLDRYGDRHLGLEDGETTLEAVLDRIEVDRFDDREDHRRTVLTVVEVDAVGRSEYTDRGAGAIASEDDTVNSL